MFLSFFIAGIPLRILPRELVAGPWPRVGVLTVNGLIAAAAADDWRAAARSKRELVQVCAPCEAERVTRGGCACARAVDQRSPLALSSASGILFSFSLHL